MSPRRQIKLLILIITIVILVGGVGYKLIEGWSILDSFYMTFITLTTVGYGEVYTLSYRGKIFTIGLIILGVGSVGYAIGSSCTKTNHS